MAASLGITLVLGAAVFLVYLSTGRSNIQRSGLEMPVLVLIVLIIGAALTLVFAQRPDFPASFAAGLLVAGSALFGLLFNAAVARQDAQRARAERRDDVQRALVAEIKHYVQALQQFPLDDAWEAMAPRIREGHVPVVPSENNATLFNAVVQDIHVLPKKVIDPVVKYYSQVNEVEAAISDIRSEYFRSGAAEDDKMRRHEMYREYLEVKLKALDYGLRALRALGASLDDVTINTPDDDR